MIAFTSGITTYHPILARNLEQQISFWVFNPDYLNVINELSNFYLYQECEV